MAKYKTQLKSFDTSKLKHVNFGKLEGEKDDKLKASFLSTNSIEKFLEVKYNYILSPKGGGKSAVFRAMRDKLISSFEYDKYSVITINSAFGFDEELAEGFKEESITKNYTLAWGAYLAMELLKDVRKNHTEKSGYKELENELKKIPDFKEKFELYNFVDTFNQLSMGVEFEVQGVKLGIKPSLKVNEPKGELLLNKLFDQINDFYKNNSITSLILIDRLDNFVKKESYLIQQKYIQALIDCIEELSNLSNISPVLFIRTDLFYSFNIDYEYDKVKERTIELKWEDGEILSFIVYRLFANQYITENYNEYFSHIMQEGNKGEHNIQQKKAIVKKVLDWIFGKKDKIDLKRTIDYTCGEKFMRLFFPKNLENFDNTYFCNWIFDYLKDANGFINPRVLIYFFNQLVESQISFNTKIVVRSSKEIVVKETEGFYCFDLFSQDIFPVVYKKIQNDELRNIHKLLKDKDYQNIFIEINQRTLSKAKFNYGDINLKKFNVEKEDYERFLKYLTLLGYCKEVDKVHKLFEVPNLYLCPLSLND